MTDSIIHGYVACANAEWNVIDGYGETEDQAIAQVIADCGPWENPEGASLSREQILDRIDVRPATKGLLQRVHDFGGAIGWGEIDGEGVYCTDVEAQMGRDLVRDIYEADPNMPISDEEWEVDTIDSDPGKIVVAYCEPAGRAGHVYVGSGSSGHVTWIDADSLEDAVATVEAEMAAAAAEVQHA